MARPAPPAALALLLLLVATTAARAGSGRKRCPIVQGKQPFDENKMAGQWHILAGTPLLGPELSRCPKLSLMPSRANGELQLNFKLNALSPRDGSPIEFESVSQALKPEKGAVSQGVWRRTGTAEWSPVYKQVVVQTDYDNYAVFLACRAVFNASTNAYGRHLAAQVWGRRPSLPQDTLDVLTNLLTSYDVEPADLKLAQHNCN